MYKHINDCWKAIEELIAKENTTPDDLDNLLEEFPRWSGDWSWEMQEDDGEYTITINNFYWVDDEYYEDADDYEPNQTFIDKYNEE